MPVLRYFLVMGCCLLGLLFATNYFLPQAEIAAAPEATAVSNGGSLASWRQSQERLDRPQTAAVVYPDIAPLAPTAERLQFERQMTYRRADAPAQAVETKSNPVYEAKAEMSDVTAAAKLPAKSVVKPQRAKVARADRRDRPNYAAAYPPAPVAQVGGYRQAQFDRPSNGWFTGFRMF